MRLDARQKESHGWAVIDRNTGETLRNVEWADDETGEYRQLVQTSFGWAPEYRTGNIKFVHCPRPPEPEPTPAYVPPPPTKQEFEGRFHLNGVDWPDQWSVVDAYGDNLLTSVDSRFRYRKVRVTIEVIE